jgi:uncharacterized protein YjbI with pentapeptide repeats
VDDHELILVDENAWCSFHAPLEDKDDNPTKKGMWKKIDSEFEKLYAAIHARIDAAKEIKETCDLTGVVFPGIANFTGKEFPSVCFSRAKFGGNANFNNAKFRGGVTDFGEAQFSGGLANFRAARFSGGLVDFREARFSGGVAFFHSTLFTGGPALFSGAHFTFGAASFRKTQFSGGNVVFDKMRFSGIADFSAPGGEDKENSEKRIFHNADFSGARFEGESEGGDFNGVTFENRKFLEQTSFKGCFFATAPRFHNCALHQDTEFDSQDTVFDSNFPDTESDGAERAYRTLKLAMEGVRSRREETRFYALEIECRRRKAPWPEKIASWVYWAVSGYGVRFTQPILWFLVFGGLFYLLYGNSGWVTDAACLGTKKLFGFTVQQIVRPFGVWALKTTDCFSHLYLKLAATVQSVLSLSLLAMFLLALRLPFRMR